MEPMLINEHMFIYEHMPTYKHIHKWTTFKNVTCVKTNENERRCYEHMFIDEHGVTPFPPHEPSIRES